MEIKEISKTVEAWIMLEDLPARADIKPVGRFDEVYEDTDWMFINWYENQEFLPLFSIRK